MASKNFKYFMMSRNRENSIEDKNYILNLISQKKKKM